MTAISNCPYVNKVIRPLSPAPIFLFFPNYSLYYPDFFFPGKDAVLLQCSEGNGDKGVRQLIRRGFELELAGECAGPALPELGE